MYLVELTLRNWGPYLGEHTLQLRDTVYAVQATSDKDAERSNWLGKSWFLGAIRFLLTGVLPESCLNEDGWITWGESEGRVAGKLSDGTTVSRTRKLGKGGTQLELRVPGREVAKQAKAQAELQQLIGVGDKDLVATCFVQQGQIARLVRADPADRTGIVNGWLQLEPLQRAEEWLRDRLNELLKQERELGQEVVVTDEQLEELQGELQAQAEAMVAAAQQRRELTEQLGKLHAWALHAQRAPTFSALQEEGKRTKAELEALAPFTEEGYAAVEQQLQMNLDTAQQRKGVASDRHYQLKELVGGQWDGTCPKTCEKCPVQLDVRKIGRKMERELATLEAQLDSEAEELDRARDELEQHYQAGERRTTLEDRLQRLRAEATEVLASVDYIAEHGAPPDLAELKVQLLAAEEAHTAAIRGHAEAEAELRNAKQARQAGQQAAGARAQLGAAIRTTQEALAVVGRQGAQREVAEGVLAEIEAGANRLLQQAEIDLEVTVSWARAGSGLATHCDACGSAYPRSLSVKACLVCSSPRGPKLVEKLTLAPNDRSGGADDIAGLAFQLSASSWLRRERGVVWAVACIDEPFGALDRANVRSLSTHLHALIRGSYAFAQGFIVAHDASVMEALPARVQIRGTETGSTIEVIG